MPPVRLCPENMPRIKPLDTVTNIFNILQWMLKNCLDNGGAKLKVSNVCNFKEHFSVSYIANAPREKVLKDARI